MISAEASRKILIMGLWDDMVNERVLWSCCPRHSQHRSALGEGPYWSLVQVLGLTGEVLVKWND